MSLATDATNASGNAMANQEKYMESYGGKLQQISTQVDAFWLSFYNSDATKFVLDAIVQITKQINNLADSFGAGKVAILGFLGAIGTIAGYRNIKHSGGRHKSQYVCLNEYASEALSVRRTSFYNKSAYS